MTRMIKEELFEMLDGKKACFRGVYDIITSKDESELVSLFWEYYRFSVAHRFPDPDYIAKHIHQAKAKGIYANAENVTLHKERQVALLGSTDALLEYDGGGCAHIIVSDNARAEIIVRDGFALWLDIHRSARVSIIAKDYSTLRIHQYGSNAYADVACMDKADYKMIKHDTETYDKL